MYYFDYNPKHGQYGVLKQQFWTLLHFPFHLSIVLSMEGLRQLSTLYGLAKYFEKEFATFPPDIAQVTDVMKWFTDHFVYLYNEGSSKTVLKSNSAIEAEIKNLTALSNSGNEDDYLFAIMDLESQLLVGIMEYYGMKASKSKDSKDKDANRYDLLMKKFKVFDLVFEYYFISFGIIFMIFGIFTFLVRPHRNIYDFIAVAIRVLVGVSMFSMIGLYTIGSEEAYTKYLYGPWPIPQVCIILVGGKYPAPNDKRSNHWDTNIDYLCAALILDKTLNYIAFKRSKDKLRRNTV